MLISVCYPPWNLKPCSEFVTVPVSIVYNLEGMVQIFLCVFKMMCLVHLLLFSPFSLTRNRVQIQESVREKMFHHSDCFKVSSLSTEMLLLSGSLLSLNV